MTRSTTTTAPNQICGDDLALDKTAMAQCSSSPFKVGVMVSCVGDLFPAFAVELRLDGMTLTTRHLISEGESLGLRFPLPGAGRLELMAVCGSQFPCPNTHTLLTHVRFDGVSHRQQQCLSRWIQSTGHLLRQS